MEFSARKSCVEKRLRIWDGAAPELLCPHQQNNSFAPDRFLNKVEAVLLRRYAELLVLESSRVVWEKLDAEYLICNVRKPYALNQPTQFTFPPFGSNDRGIEQIEGIVRCAVKQVTSRS